jgi:hypothetical protein
MSTMLLALALAAPVPPAKYLSDVPLYGAWEVTVKCLTTGNTQWEGEMYFFPDGSYSSVSKVSGDVYVGEWATKYNYLTIEERLLRNPVAPWRLHMSFFPKPGVRNRLVGVGTDPTRTVVRTEVTFTRKLP